jgi:hypothetical protein
MTRNLSFFPSSPNSLSLNRNAGWSNISKAELCAAKILTPRELLRKAFMLERPEMRDVLADCTDRGAYVFGLRPSSVAKREDLVEMGFLRFGPEAVQCFDLQSIVSEAVLFLNDGKLGICDEVLSIHEFFENLLDRRSGIIFEC